ncbi:hypothetical protein IHQ71_02495 [Rhizobium sp. TH2]|uniref:hypothetical protein n=1 Tax=Rhizobium sp. TH2 TaxID=2775403 RepID=UPI00215780E4|nr:hypothetical protein [Rhizobium sp. TH2]UVC09514.1 hypothetical protein IHQ71_02495 [Rhizobium sp. TH2]
MPSGAQSSSLVLILVTLSSMAQAHVDKTTGQDYRDFTRNDGLGSCCNWHDCRPAHAPVTEPDGEKIIDFANNKYRFDPSKLVKRPSDDGNWHVCGDALKLKCIIAPVESRRDGDGFESLVGGILVAEEESVIAMKITPHQLRPSDRLRLSRPAYPLPQGER